MKDVRIFTDGGCLGNPGPGGYGVVLKHKQHAKELSGGFKLTTNNRMELTACIVGLETLKEECSVTVTTDSKYVVNSIVKGWAVRWRANNWFRNKKERAENSDLWARLLVAIEKHDTKFVWVKGHAGHPENERCDELAGKAARSKNLPKDPNYPPKNEPAFDALFD